MKEHGYTYGTDHLVTTTFVQMPNCSGGQKIYTFPIYVHEQNFFKGGELLHKSSID